MREKETCRLLTDKCKHERGTHSMSVFMFGLHSQEVFKRDIQKRHSKETSVREKETYRLLTPCFHVRRPSKRDIQRGIQKRRPQETYKRDL